MEQCSPFGWVYYNQEEGMMGELRQYIMQSRMELEATIIIAQEEIMKKDEELLNIKDLLLLAVKERDESQLTLQTLTLENPNTNYTHQSEQDHINTTIPPPLQPPQVGGNHRPLLEHGHLLKAVIEAGPLLETLLLVGPLPQWQHPPPHIGSFEIPQLNIRHTSSNKKRRIHDFDCSQRI